MRHVGTLVLGTLLLAACTVAPGASGTPSASASAAIPSASAAVTATETPNEGPPYVMNNWHLARALVNGIQPREAPSLQAPLVDTGGGPFRLAAGDVVLVIGGGVYVDALYWYEIIGIPGGASLDSVAFGWIAGGTASDPRIAEATPSCPGDPSLADLAAMAAFVRLACYGNQPLTFDAFGSIIPDGIGFECDLSPERQETVGWLLCSYAWVNDAALNSLLLHFDPATLEAPNMAAIQGQPFRITGHFDDASSTLCGEGVDDEGERNRETWRCAMMFVVETMEPLM